MNFRGMMEVMETMNEEECSVYDEGYKEYAHSQNAFANFDRIAESLGLGRTEVLMVYLLKHIDGISSYIQGHRSQREDIRGRIKDARVYLALLRGMVEENEDHGELDGELV